MAGIESVGAGAEGWLPPARPDRRAGGDFASQLRGLQADGQLPPMLAPAVGAVRRGFSVDHPGLDLAMAVDSPVQASADGVVESAGWAGERGNLLVVRSGPLRAYYGHLQSFDAVPGQQVQAGEAIAHSGATGDTPVPALHFELHLDGQPVDPASVLAQAQA